MEARTLLSLHYAAVGHIEYALSGTYLGFAVGLGRQKELWCKAMGKYRNRVLTWRVTQQSLHCACLTYNTCIVTVLSYIWQLSSLPPDFDQIGRKAMSKLVPGPGNWILPQDLWMLRSGWGYSARFISPRPRRSDHCRYG